ncbi:Ribosomal protein L11 methyltransferase [Rhodovulum sp. PH10]|uniref:50S ribosomal protein L11 methyltransferase n=1 Tax=Rhodovulum sp. PH10 TaxID=1187851 RepID=UPI00027C2049|nr:50S ribosomal protein L11 methyltransferase [Rhodovulum sp. PH10]EJW11511.1 Ribosomal protein L11 methyltransferase [Rhodovulum sp. PH10]
MREGLQPAKPATVARLVTTEQLARRIADLIGESFDPEETAVAAYEQPDERSWGVEVFFETPPDEAAVRALVALASDAATADSMTFGTLEQKDWVAASLEGLAPVPAGKFLVHGAHDRHRVKPNHIGIEIDAALAFGTGHHGTTRGCLLALDRLLKTRNPRPVRPGAPRTGAAVLDVGTGTGILAIAAAKTLRQKILASDIDPAAVRVARENVRLNRTAPLIEMVVAPGLNAPRVRRASPASIVFANILLGPLTRMAGPLARAVAPGGYAILSGLLAKQAAAALAVYRAHGLKLVGRIGLDGWVTLVLTRPRSASGRRGSGR